MNVQHIEILVEERSMEAALHLLLPKLLTKVSYAIYVSQCKQELLLRLPERLKGYANWLPVDWRIIVLVDRDDDDCTTLKQNLEGMAAAAGLRTRASAGKQTYSVISRLAIEELEAWYFGDWIAVKMAFQRVSATIPQKAAFRDPDAITGGTWEALERVLQRVGYFQSGLRKIEAARMIAQHMDPSRNCSRSFQTIRNTLLQCDGGWPAPGLDDTRLS
jgi:hypothetical protein